MLEKQRLEGITVDPDETAHSGSKMFANFAIVVFGAYGSELWVNSLA